MLYYALLFLVIALIAAVFGFGASPTRRQVAKILFFVFLVLFLLAFVGNLVTAAMPLV